MTRQEVLEKTKTVIFDCFPEMKDQDIKEDSVINTETAIDSMGFVLVVCKLEALFDVRTPVRQWAKVQTLSDVVDAIYKRLPDKA
jgi:acyl carrier protein